MSDPREVWRHEGCRVLDSNNHVVAEVHGRFGEPVSGPQMARQIAANPDLLEALESLLRQFPWQDSLEARAARDALAKARGVS